MRLGQTGLVRVRWTNAIHDEWIERLLANEPQRSRERLLRTCDLMNHAIGDCLVTGYEHRIESRQ